MWWWLSQLYCVSSSSSDSSSDWVLISPHSKISFTSAVEKNPSMSDLNETLLGQEHFKQNDLSFVFRLQCFTNERCFSLSTALTITSDISNRARILLSRWSELLTRSQALTKPNGMKLLTNSQTNMILKQSIGDIMSDETWKSNIDLPENFGTPNVNVDNMRKSESHQALKLLPASSDDLNRKNALGLPSSRFRECRKVQMVEQPEQKIAGRNLQAPITSLANQGRPMSTDDIQKAKMRAQFMQSKYGKTGSSNGRTTVKFENANKPLRLVSGASSPAACIQNLSSSQA